MCVVFQAELLHSHLEPWNEVAERVVPHVFVSEEAQWYLLELNLRTEMGKMMDDHDDVDDDG